MEETLRNAQRVPMNVIIRVKMVLNAGDVSQKQ